MDLPRLNNALLPNLQGIEAPTYDRNNVTAGILHIGIGAFHRAHQAVYSDDLLNMGELNWGIISASLRSPTAQQQLQDQDGLYCVCTLAPNKVGRRVIGAIQQVITANTQQGFEELVSIIASPNIHVITTTVTEKGYCHVSGGLDATHADIQHDLGPQTQKRSLPGVITAGLQARCQQGSGPISVVSCDNLASNGVVLGNVVTEYAQLSCPELIPWITANVSFPSTMVDRIVPATTQEDHQRLAQEWDLEDRGLVVCEPFRQWVIEDCFAGPRPPWEKAGALLVEDVSPYETAKLRLLNAPHSACAYLGLMLGHEFVHQAMTDRPLQDFVTQLVHREILPTVKPLPNLDLVDYASSIFQRFENSAIAYGTRQVGSDGSQKLSQRLIPVINERLQAGESIADLAVVIAAWLEHLQAPAPDPLADQLKTSYETHHDPAQLIDVVCEQTSIRNELGELYPNFREQVSAALVSVRTQGLYQTLAQHLR